MKPTVAEIEIKAVPRLQADIYKDPLSVHIRKHGHSMINEEFQVKPLKKSHIAPVYEILHWEEKGMGKLHVTADKNIP